MQLIPLLFRSKIIVLLAASMFMLAAVGAKADRTIDVRLSCQAAVDLCSSDSTFILVCDAGTLNSSDSVSMYDVTLAYPKEKILLVSVLYNGTFSEGLEYKDYNAKTDGEVRVYGFNLFKPMVGTKAFFALLFKLKASCDDSTEINFASLPGFNPEAKVVVNNLIKTIVPTQIANVSSRSLNCKFSNDTIVFTKQGQRNTVECTLLTKANARLEFAEVELSIDKTRFSITKLEAVNTTDSLEVEHMSNTSVIRVFRKDASFLEPQCGFRLELQSLDTTRKTESPCSMKLRSHNRCACVTRDTSDTTLLLNDYPSSTPVDDEDFGVTLKSDGDVWELYNRTESPVELEIYTVLGACIQKMTVGAQSSCGIDRTRLSKGLCVLQYRTQRDRIKKQLKFN